MVRAVAGQRSGYGPQEELVSVTVQVPRGSVGKVHQLEKLESGPGALVIGMSEELTPNEAARVLGVSRTTIMKRVDRGEIPFRRVGTHVRIRMASIEAYLAAERQRMREGMNEINRISDELGLE
ncbi:MAG: helix-turn-helix domain-containing protein [Ancrocorticia sp.]|uniref:helix-turn-helix domain-containing protein n=1 Tax=Ancrocorticia sp. TaxID=2593684 RepID=UPI003F8EF7F5